MVAFFEKNAVSASIHFNIFHSHNDRVKMANLAQTVNVLQSVILTYEDVMIKTPTYHVFDLYKEHQDNTFIPLEEETGDYKGLPKTSSTVSIDEKDGKIFYSVSNADPNDSVDMEVMADGIDLIKTASGRLLTAPEITACNTVENPDYVNITDFNDIEVSGNKLQFTLPPRSVMTITIN